LRFVALTAVYISLPFVFSIRDKNACTVAAVVEVSAFDFNAWWWRGGGIFATPRPARDAGIRWHGNHNIG
jgi:hypothetical protein